MAGITLKDAQKHLKAWLTAELELTSHQSYSIGSRTLTKANLKEVREQVKFWNNYVARLENSENRRGRNHITRVVPRDL